MEVPDTAQEYYDQLNRLPMAINVTIDADGLVHLDGGIAVQGGHC